MSSQNKNLRKYKTPRPQTAFSTAPVRKQMRIQSSQKMNSLRNDIKTTLKDTNKSFQHVKQMTSSLDSKYHKRIDRMCIQYSICKRNTRYKTPQQNIDSDYIAKMYIRNRSKQKNKEGEKEQLRKSIRAVANRYSVQEHQQFFKFDRQSLINMQEKYQKKANKKKSGIHPYLKIYETSQNQAMQSLIQNKRLGLGQVNQYPLMGQAQEWQRDQRSIKHIYTGLRRLRAQTARSHYRSQNIEQPTTLFIT